MTVVVTAPAFAQIPDPTKHLPKVPVPTVQVPVPTVQVPVPTVQVPVPVPTVQVPVPTVQVPVPTVQVPVPTVQVPSAPPGAPPSGSGGGSGSGSGGGSGAGGGSGSAGSGAGGGSGSAGGGSSGSGSGGGSTGSGTSGSGSGSGGGSAGSRDAGGDGAAGGRGGSGGASESCKTRTSGACRDAARGPSVPSARDLARMSPAERRVANREQRLRETVARAGGCLDELPSSQRRVLTLRAGVGSGPARSRKSVARRLDVSVRKVARIENAGLRRLRALASGGACAGSVAPGTSTASGLAVEPVASAVAPPRSGGGGGGGGGGAGGGGGSENASSPGVGGVDAEPTPGAGVRGATRSNLPAATAPASGLDLLVPAILLGLAAMAFVFVRTLRREGDPAPVEAPPEEPVARPRWDDPPPGL